MSDLCFDDWDWDRIHCPKCGEDYDCYEDSHECPHPEMGRRRSKMMKDNHTPGDRNKPTHRDYSSACFPNMFNEGLDEMEAYYEPLLAECLEAMQIYVDRVERDELDHRYPYSKYKAILAKTKEERDEKQKDEQRN